MPGFFLRSNACDCVGAAISTGVSGCFAAADRCFDTKTLGVEQWLSARYSQPHNTRSDKAPYAYTDALKAENLRKAGSLHRVSYDNKIHVVRNALGLHTRTAVVHGRWLNVRHEISYCSHVQIFARAVLENDRDP